MRRVFNLIKQWEWLFLLLLIPILLFATGYRALFLLALPVLWVARWLDTRHFFTPTPYDVTILALIFMVLVSSYALFDIELSFPKIAGMVLSTSLFYGAVAHTRERTNGLWHLLIFFFIAGTGMTCVSLIGTEWLTPFTFLNEMRNLLPSPLRIPGTITGMINANEVAGMLAWLTPILLAMVGLWRPFQNKRKYLLITWAGISLFLLLILVATQSRGGILALVAGVLVMLAIVHRWGRWLMVTAVLVAIGFALYPGADKLLLGNGTEIGQLGLQGRLEIWSRALYGLADFPLTGMSMNGFRRVVHILYPLFLIAPTTDIAHAHNHLLQAGLDLGIPGLVAYLAMWLVSVALLQQSWQQVVCQLDRALIVGLSGALAAGWTFGVFDAIALGARPGFLWWLLLAMIVGVHDSVMRSA